MSLAFTALGERDQALTAVKGAGRLATTSGLKLVALRAHARLCSIAPDDEAANTAAGERLVAELLAAVPQDLRDIFSHQPELRPLLSAR